MTQPPPDNLESRLSEATTWTGPSTQLWKRAAASQAKPSILSFDVIAFTKRRWFPLVATSSAACLALAAAVFSTTKSAPFMFVGFDESPSREAAQSFATVPEASAPLDMWGLVRANQSTPKQFNSPSSADSYDYQNDVRPGIASPSPAGATRHVIHKATIELTTPDVRAAFLKAGLILNEALGEHIQDSSLTGSGNDASATLTLRVVAARLSEVCNALRDLGVVASERREGQDVTGQVIDVEARLRNEQRAEKELLELFDQRKDAPLKDVLDLRQKLSEVRAGIEQLVAQRDRLSRLVSLATVLVIIRTGEKPPEEPEDEGLSHYFSESIKHAWSSGTRGLADTVAALVSILIGGLIWWILLIVALLLLRRYVRNRGGKA